MWLCLHSMCCEKVENGKKTQWKNRKKKQKEKTTKQTCLFNFQRQTSPENEPVATVSSGVVSTDVMLCVGELVHRPSGTAPSVIPSAKSQTLTHSRLSGEKLWVSSEKKRVFPFFFPPLCVKDCVFFFLGEGPFREWQRPRQHLMHTP